MECMLYLLVAYEIKCIYVAIKGLNTTTKIKLTLKRR